MIINRFNVCFSVSASLFTGSSRDFRFLKMSVLLAAQEGFRLTPLTDVTSSNSSDFRTFSGSRHEILFLNYGPTKV